MNSIISQLQAPRNTADKVFVTRKETPSARNASDFRPIAGGASISGSEESGSKPVEEETAKQKIQHPKPQIRNTSMNICAVIKRATNTIRPTTR